MSGFRKSFTDINPGHLFLALSAVVGISLVWDAHVTQLVTYFTGADFWEHTAVLNEWMKNLREPQNPHLLDPSPSPRYMPYFFILAAVGRVLSLDAVQVLYVGAILGFMILVLGVQLFFKAYFRHQWAPTVGLVILLTGWGASWNWSNVYQLRIYPYIAAYPSNIVFGLSLISFWFVLVILRSRTTPMAACVAFFLLCGLMFVCHPFTGAFALGSCCLLAITEWGAGTTRKVLVISIVIAGAIAVESWPYFSVWDLTFGQVHPSASTSSSNLGERLSSIELRRSVIYGPFYSPKQIAISLGPALVGIPVLVWLAWKRKYLFIPVGAIAMGIPYVANAFVRIPLGHRFLLLGVFFLHLAVTWLALHIICKWQEKAGTKSARAARLPLFILWGFLGSMVVWNIGLLVAEMSGIHLNPTLSLEIRPPQTIATTEWARAITRDLPDNAVIMAEKRIAWPLPTFRGKIVALHHNNPLVANNKERREDVESFYADETSSDRRQEILKKYGVTHIVIRRDSESRDVLSWIDANSKFVTTTGLLEMREVLRPENMISNNVIQSSAENP